MKMLTDLHGFAQIFLKKIFISFNELSIDDLKK